MNPVIGEPLGDFLGGAAVQVSTGDPVVSNMVLERCGIEATAGSAAPQPGMGSGIADLVARQKPPGLC